MAKAEGGKPKPSGKKNSAPPDGKSQADRFIETARQLGADESGILFDAAAKKLLPPRDRT